MLKLLKLVTMEVKIIVDEELVCLINSSTKKDISSVMTEALNQWAKQNITKCPIDEKYCTSKEPCNSCSKINQK